MVEDGAVQGRPGDSKAGGYFGNRNVGSFGQRADGLDIFGGEFVWAAAFSTASTRRGPNKGEAKNALAKTVFFNRLGEVRDRSFENQQYRASGLNLFVAAITLWSTVYLERAVTLLGESQTVDTALLQHVSPLGWEHVGLTGDYFWHSDKRVKKGGFRPLRPLGTGLGSPWRT
jgi:hypothetical protein